MNWLQNARARREKARKIAGAMAIIDLTNVHLENAMKEAQITNECDKARLKMDLEQRQARTIIKHLKRK